MSMFLSTLFGVKPVDEADDALTERDYPSKQKEADNTAIDSITFTPTLQLPETAYPSLKPSHNNKHKHKSEGEPRADISSAAGIQQQSSGSREKGMENTSKRSQKTFHRGVSRHSQDLATARGQKLRKCKDCGETFTWATKLQEHLRSHERDYEAKMKERADVKCADSLEKWGGSWKTDEEK